jgi:hypothetical protein
MVSQRSLINNKGYKSSGPDEVVMTLQDKPGALIGLNDADKISASKALKKLFGSSLVNGKFIGRITVSGNYYLMKQLIDIDTLHLLQGLVAYTPGWS